MLKKPLALQNKRWVPYALMAIGLGLIAFGVFRGEARMVLRKAIQICQECIGIG